MKEPPRLLIEEWLPAAAIGVECMRERGSASALAPTTYLHVWWARRPLTASRAAVLGSLLPADFPHDVFERLLGFGRPGSEIIQIRQILDGKPEGVRIAIGFDFDRAFKRGLRVDDLRVAHNAANELWSSDIVIIDPMAGGGSIPLEAARVGFHTLTNEYNPVGCSILEATTEYPFRFGDKLAARSRAWARVWIDRASARLSKFYYEPPARGVRDYIFARTVPCPDTQHYTPLVPDWHLAKPNSGARVVAEPIVDKQRGTWKVRIREVGTGAGQIREAPQPTYNKGKGVSLFTGRPIPADYIKAKAQAGEMRNELYAIAVKTPDLKFVEPTAEDFKALADAEKELARLRPGWEKANIIPTEFYPEVSSDPRPRAYGMPRWADMFAPRQLLCMGVLVEELLKLRPEIIKTDGPELGEAVVHLLAFVIDKFLNYNSVLASWNAPRQVMRSVFDRHDFSFKASFAEMAPCNAGAGLEWATDNVLEAYEELARLAANNEQSRPVEISLGSATSLPQIADGSITAVVVDPPYADNVQYSELADFFYVWLKRTQGHRHPDWFSTNLSQNDQEAVVNVSRHLVDGGAGRKKRKGETAEAKEKANEFYRKLMVETFTECRRILRDDGVLTVMFTHKQQEKWEALFSSLIKPPAAFRITATWPVKTESDKSLHQAKKNAAQSTVIIVCRKRAPGAGVGYFDSAMRREIHEKARERAARLQTEGLNRVDQLVGAFGPAVEVFSRYDEVRTDTGEPVNVDRALDEAADAVSGWRVEQIAARGLEGVEAEGRFALLCWDVLGAGEFRFNEAKLLGHAVGMDVQQLVAAGLVEKDGDKIFMLSAKERRRERALEPDEVTETLFGSVTTPKKRTKKDALKVHPNDPVFRTALDACHALALRYLEGANPAGGIGSARALARQQRWGADSAVAKLMSALLTAAPEAVRHEKGKKSAAAKYPEFRAWHALLKPLFGIEPPDWTEKPPPQGLLALKEAEQPADDEEIDDGAETEEVEE
jgi:putative DNA methylase